MGVLLYKNEEKALLAIDRLKELLKDPEYNDVSNEIYNVISLCHGFEAHIPKVKSAKVIPEPAPITPEIRSVGFINLFDTFTGQSPSNFYSE